MRMQTSVLKGKQQASTLCHYANVVILITSADTRYSLVRLAQVSTQTEKSRTDNSYLIPIKVIQF